MRFIEHIKMYYIKYISALVMAITLTLIYLFTRGFTSLIFYIDAFGIAGAALFFISLLSLVNNHGAFDIFSYSFGKLFNRTKYDTLRDYVLLKESKNRKNRFIFLPYMVVGVTFVAASLIMTIWL